MGGGADDDTLSVNTVVLGSGTVHSAFCFHGNVVILTNRDPFDRKPQSFRYRNDALVLCEYPMLCLKAITLSFEAITHLIPPRLRMTAKDCTKANIAFYLVEEQAGLRQYQSRVRNGQGNCNLILPK